MSTDVILNRANGFRRVVLVTGHVTDAAGRGSPRFPEDGVAMIAARISAVLNEWQLGAQDLVITGGARGADLLAARAARERGATVWLLLALQPEAFVETSVAGGAERWVEEFWSMVARVPVWVMPAGASPDEVFAEANEWMLRVARAQAEHGRLTVLAVWDGRQAQGRGGTGEMVQEARRLGAEVVVLDPMPREIPSDEEPRGDTS